MSKAKKCDRCGELFEPFQEDIWVTERTAFCSAPRDLCPECYEQLYKWFKDPEPFSFMPPKTTKEE